MKKNALVIVDPQNDFCPGGALPVIDGHKIMRLICAILGKYNYIVITADNHTDDQISFAKNHKDANPFDLIQVSYGDQVAWPSHCVQGTFGAEFHPDILPAVHKSNIIIRKGMNPEIDSYSAFYENDQKTSTGLAGYLSELCVDDIDFVGLAFDFCVGYSALDAIECGFNARIIKHLTKAIDINGSEADMTKRLVSAGVKII